MLSQRMTGHAGSLSDATLNGLVSGIIIENEQIGPTRYIATLGVLFDRGRAGSLLGVGGHAFRSPPMLVIPIEWSGGVARSLERRTGRSEEHTSELQTLMRNAIAAVWLKKKKNT